MQKWNASGEIEIARRFSDLDVMAHVFVLIDFTHVMHLAAQQLFQRQFQRTAAKHVIRKRKKKKKKRKKKKQNEPRSRATPLQNKRKQ
jgi:hypothetical protein